MRAIAGQSFFYPVHLTLFTVISMETRNISGVSIQFVMTHFFDLLVTGSNLKRSIASGAKNNSNATIEPGSRARTVQLRAENRCWRAASQEHPCDLVT